ncbi:MAG: tRNA uridine-5-carboxymethylaminomethyl(34) synthesis GTPase MnmE [Orrella sp.]
MIGHDDSSIAAIATAPGRGGIGVIRVSGKSLKTFISVVLRQELEPRYAHYLPFLDESENLIDQGIALFFEGPHSYTGEDVLELQAHGGTAVLQRLLDYLLVAGKAFGLRLATPGEFSFRAYMNDKIDLVQAEAIDDLINASSTAAAAAAVESLSGTFSTEINGVADELVQLRTLVEATLDFPEEEIEFIEKYQIRSRLEHLIERVQSLLNQTEQSQFLSSGLKVALAGEPNVGKSSLMNAIFGDQIAIVTNIPGTTRDSIKENLVLDGVPITIVDTAGLRSTTDVIETMGITRSIESILSSDVVLDIVDARRPQSILQTFSADLDLSTKPVVHVHNKVDLLTSPLVSTSVVEESAPVYVSAHDGTGLDLLKQAVLAHTGRKLGEKSPWLARKRHVVAIKAALEHLMTAGQFATHQDAVLDLLAEELRLSHQQLGSITGHMDADELLGEIFSNFCIGK